MSELKVLVDDKEREIRGVGPETTCESIILVLAKAAGKTGKVALLERWRDHERILPPGEFPLKSIQSWGAFRHEVSLVLQDESPSTYNHFNKPSINLTIDDTRDLIKRSIDCESQENWTALQQRKLQRLARAIEILDLQFSCWNGNEEAFLYLTDEEIAEDLSVKLGKALKLQAKELVELETWENELQNLQQTNENLSTQREIFTSKISKLEERIAEANDAVDMLLDELGETENMEKERKHSQSALVRDELVVISRELSQQDALFHKQDQELNAIRSSMSDLNASLDSKNNAIRRLRTEIESCSDEFSLSENFLPQTPEAESTLKNYEDDHNIGLSENDLEPNYAFQKMKNQDKSREIQSSSTEIEPVTETEHGEDQEDGFLPNIDKNSSLESEELLTKPSQQPLVQKRLHFPSLSPKFYLENGVNEMDHTLEISNSKEKINAPSSESIKNDSKLDQISPIPKDLRPVSPEIITRTSMTKKGSSTPKSVKRKESFKKIREVFENQDTNSGSTKEETVSTENVSRNDRRPPTLPKPTRNNVLAPQLGNKLLPLEERLGDVHRSVDSVYSKSQRNLIVVPKPYGSSITSLGSATIQKSSKILAKSRGINSPSLESFPLPQSSVIKNPEMNTTEGGLNAVDVDSKLEKNTSKISGTNVGVNRRHNKSNIVAESDEGQPSNLALTTLQDNIAKPYEVNSSGFGLTTGQDNSKFIPKPYVVNSTSLSSNLIAKPYGIHSTKLATSKLPLSYGQTSRTYLTPPPASNNKRHSKKNNIISNGDSTEQGVFV